MKKLSQLFICILSLTELGAQSSVELIRTQHHAAKQSAVCMIPCSGAIQPAQGQAVFEPVLSQVVYPNPEPGLDSLQKIKQALTMDKLSVNPSPNEEREPVQARRFRSGVQIGRQFEGNTGHNGCPPDNTIAISNGGQIISIVNGNLFHFNENGVYQNAWTLSNFINAPGLTPNVCDPKVLYDSQEDRFVVFAQTCDGSMSEFVLCFSQTNYPGAGWWVYRFYGDPMGFGRMFDYPKMAFSANELILTGNLFGSSGFSEAMIFQFAKSSGYNGLTLPSQYWYNIQGAPFTILPLRYGLAGNYGNSMYLVSTAAGGNNSFNLYHLTDQMSASNEQLIHQVIGTDAYSMAGNSYQAGSSHVVNSGDCRAMDGYYLGGVVHFAHHTNDANWSAIRYTRYNIGSSSGTYSTITFTGTKDYCYPALSSFSNSSSDQSSVLSFLASGPSLYPEIRAKYFDHNFGTSSSILVKTGLGPVYTCYDPGKASDRWGDYSGSARRYNSSLPQVWINGCYGNNFGSWNTYIAELSQVPTGIDSLAQAKSALTLFPNPAKDRVTIQFTYDKKDKLRFTLLDALGKQIAAVYEGYAEIGLNEFTFNISTLANGTYYLRIHQDEKLVQTEKVIVNR